VPEAFLDFCTIRAHAVGRPWMTCRDSKTFSLSSATEPRTVASRALAPGSSWNVAELQLDGVCAGIVDPGSYEITLLYRMPPSADREGGATSSFAGFWQGELADTVIFSIIKPTR